MIAQKLLESYHLLQETHNLELRDYLIDLENALKTLTPEEYRLVQLAYLLPNNNPKHKSRSNREARLGKMRTLDEMIEIDEKLNPALIRQRLVIILEKLERMM